jgi:hypothetical protein
MGNKFSRALEREVRITYSQLLSFDFITDFMTEVIDTDPQLEVQALLAT